MFALLTVCSLTFRPPTAPFFLVSQIRDPIQCRLLAFPVEKSVVMTNDDELAWLMNGPLSAKSLHSYSSLDVTGE